MVRARPQLLRLATGCLPLLLAGCLETGRPIIADRSEVPHAASLPRDRSGARTYVVRKGDTLYSIAWRFELDYQGLARANGIAAPYVIHPGRTLRLVSQRPAGERITQRAPAPLKPRATVPPAAAKPAAPAATGKWVWPLHIKPSVEYSRASKGMDFVLDREAGADARSAAAGQVVYAGGGLGGFERLVIVKHDASLLSAYSFDGEVLVAERQQVAAGAPVARIRNRGGAKPSLHFELRRDGAPINPRSKIN